VILGFVALKMKDASIVKFDRLDIKPVLRQFTAEIREFGQIHLGDVSVRLL
jgi:hypothetical protein